MSDFIGIDLGTSNCAIARVGDTGHPENLPITQAITASSEGEKSLLPSAIYLPAEGEFPESYSRKILGLFARERGALQPDRLIVSAKSWLCHPHADRRGPILPWGSTTVDRKLSPLEASSDLLAHLLDPFGRLAWAPPHRIDASPAIGSAADIRWYNGRPIRPVRIERMRVTAYSPDERSCGDSADGITASGYSVSTNGGFLVAADPKVLPLGSLVSVPGYDSGEVVPVLDVGGAIKGARLDVLFPTHEEAVRWGVRALDVTIWEYADGKPNDFKRLRRPAKRTP